MLPLLIIGSILLLFGFSLGTYVALKGAYNKEAAGWMIFTALVAGFLMIAASYTH
jgi:hypothetical protein